jgi:hypothetical protein
MTPASHRRKAEQCRQIAAERPGTIAARVFLERAESHDTAADLLTELRKINAALPLVTKSAKRTTEVLH